MKKILEVQNLKVAFNTEVGRVEAVKDISFHVNKGEIFAIVGESGAGKSVCALSLTGLLEYAGADIEGGRIYFNGAEIDYHDDDTLRQMRGGDIAYIFQEPIASLNPLHTIEKQITERLVKIEGYSRQDADKRALELLNLVGLKDPESRMGDLPHTFSGGERQRIMIAAALAGNPSLLIADEPTTSLDVTVQRQILELLSELRLRLGMSIILITHNLEIVRNCADRVAVVKDGIVVEEGVAMDVFTNPQNSYTKELVDAPSILPDVCGCGGILLDVRNINVIYSGRNGRLGRKKDLHAVKDLSFTLRRGESLGIVGESGSGKTSLMHAILRLIPFTGDIFFKDTCISKMAPKQMQSMRRYMQVVFQDPYGSLNPRMTVAMIVGEGLRAYGVKDKDILRIKVSEALESVGLDPAIADRYPHEFSGGQRQRIAIARAVLLNPDLLILDEPTSSLDRSVQFQVVELLKGIQKSHNISYIFVSHDLRLVRSVCHNIIVMKDGELVEYGTADKILNAPEHDYTRALISAAYL